MDLLKQLLETKSNVDQPLFAVGWTGQYLEWYGDDQMDKGQYKQKGEGGDFVAINVPQDDAKEIVHKLDDAYDQNMFHEKMVYHKMGEHQGVIHYNGAYIVPMNELKQHELEMIKKSPDVVDYYKGQKYGT